MKYLFGDGTESNLSFNYLEYLRAALEFSASVLKGETNVEARKTEAGQARARAEDEIVKLEKIGNEVDRALEYIGGEAPTPGARAYVENIRAVAKSEIDSAKSSVESGLTNELQRLSSIISDERAANERRLERLLTTSDLPETTVWVNASVDGEGKLQAILEGRSEIEVDYSVALDTPSNHLFSSPLRIDRIDPELAITGPQSAVFGRKSVKPKAFKLAKEFAVGVSHTDIGVVLQLRNSPTEGHSGYDLVYVEGGVMVTRISKQKPGEPFAAYGEDGSKLAQLFDTINKAMDELTTTRKALKSVTFNGIPLRDHEEPSRLIHILVAKMIPIVREIKRRSLSRGELVIKRVLGGDRREEVFVSIADLRSTLDGLPDDKRSLFDPLGLNEYEDDSRNKNKYAREMIVDELENDGLLEDADYDIEEELSKKVPSPPRRSSIPPPFRPSSPPQVIGRTSSLTRPTKPPPPPYPIPQPKKK